MHQAGTKSWPWHKTFQVTVPSSMGSQSNKLQVYQSKLLLLKKLLLEQTPLGPAAVLLLLSQHLHHRCQLFLKQALQIQCPRLREVRGLEQMVSCKEEDELDEQKNHTPSSQQMGWMTMRRSWTDSGRACPRGPCKSECLSHATPTNAKAMPVLEKKETLNGSIHTFEALDLNRGLNGNKFTDREVYPTSSYSCSYGVHA